MSSNDVHSLKLEEKRFNRKLRRGFFTVRAVVLATHRDSGRLVAVKIVCKSYLNPDDPSRALVERQVLEMAAGSPFCTHAYATFQTKGHLFYVMDYLRGGDLWELLQARQTLDLPTLRLLAAELLCGLQYLHSRGVIHRDIKLENILLDQTGDVKIADYGISAINVFECNIVTRVRGFLHFMAPEMVSNEPYDRTADFYALGVLLCEAAFDKHPFDCVYNDNQAPRLGDEPSYPEDADPVFADFLNKGFRNLTRGTIKLEDLIGQGTLISAEKQKMFNGFSFISDEWRAMQKLK